MLKREGRLHGAGVHVQDAADQREGRKHKKWVKLGILDFVRKAGPREGCWCHHLGGISGSVSLELVWVPVDGAVVDIAGI